MTRLRRSLATAALVAGSLAALGHHSAGAATSVGPKAYYLALGDSLAYGFQPILQWKKGYADDFHAQIVGSGTTSTLINMGCPAETLTSFIYGGCPLRFLLKYKYQGPQLTAALAFIAAHPDQVSPVTIDVGANDFLKLFDPATCSISSTQSITDALNAFDANFSSVLRQLHTALGGTGDLLTMTYYFPYQNLCPNMVPLVQRFNLHIAVDAWLNGARLATVFKDFGGAATPNPNLCAYTWICNTRPDIHPTTLGYSIIATSFENAAGY